MPNAPGGGGEAWVSALFVVSGLIVIVGAAAKLSDIRGKREAEAMHLQAQIADALLRDRALSGLPVVATAHSFLKGSPVTIEVSGHVPSTELGQVAMRLIEREASRVRPDMQILDRLEAPPSMATRAA